MNTATPGPDIDQKFPLELDEPRFSVKDPKIRYDMQGDLLRSLYVLNLLLPFEEREIPVRLGERGRDRADARARRGRGDAADRPRRRQRPRPLRPAAVKTLDAGPPPDRECGVSQRRAPRLLA